MAAIALFGAGRIGAIHAANAAALPALTLKYVVDPAPDAAARLAQRWGAAVASAEQALATQEWPAW